MHYVVENHQIFAKNTKNTVFDQTSSFIFYFFYQKKMDPWFCWWEIQNSSWFQNRTATAKKPAQAHSAILSQFSYTNKETRLLSGWRSEIEAWWSIWLHYWGLWHLKAPSSDSVGVERGAGAFLGWRAALPSRKDDIVYDWRSATGVLVYLRNCWSPELLDLAKCLATLLQNRLL